MNARHSTSSTTRKDHPMNTYLHARNRAILGALCLAFAALAGTAAMVENHADQPAPACSPDRVDALQRGLSYAEGFRAAAISHGADADTLAMADQNVAATVAALDACTGRMGA